ncbi:MAG TPA: hypothetical protein VM733_05605 [Thermoanaerobaculia bacterium]|nr:hypothetical protein [Thermoanaerobaculia bacterium]
MRSVLIPLLFLATSLRAADPMCGTSPENDQRVRAVHETSHQRVRSLAERTVAIRDGAFYVQNDDSITPGYHPFDLAGQSLDFTRLGTTGFILQRRALHYNDPAGEPVRDFKADPSSTYFAHALPFSFPFNGQSYIEIFITAFNGIAFQRPVDEAATQFDELEAAVHRQPILSPLMTTTRRPRQLEAPKVWITENGESIAVTWRSTGNAPFGYDVQAVLSKNGAITYSYKSVTAMRWGAPVILPGFDPATVTRTPIAGVDDSTADANASIPTALRQMLNVKRVEVQRLRDSDLFAIRIILNEPIDRTKLVGDEALSYQATIGIQTAAVDVSRNATQVASFTGQFYEPGGASANVSGDVIEIYGIQRDPEQSFERSLRVQAIHRPSNRLGDTATIGIPFTPAPRVMTSDLSKFSSAPYDLPIAETFTLGEFDPFEVWAAMKSAHALSDYDYDGIAMYQSHYTNMIFYAGAYATGGNPQVDGVAAYAPSYGRHAGRAPTLLHMNQLTYNYSAAEDTASKVMLHEFGHRWLYFFSIRENGTTGHFLNPISAHPAAYVHTASAFPVYGPNESSVMGGAYFTPQPDGTYKAYVANYGYSWTDLYLMGLAAPEEVPPWFYIANTDLPKAYWPAQGQIADGDRRNVELSQVTAVHGARTPSVALAQKRFRVLFVLVTEDAEPTEAEVAKLNQWREVMSRNFDIATGGRGRLDTAFVRAAKTRAAR